MAVGDPAGLSQEKAEIRRKMKERRAMLPESQRQSQSKAICEQLLSSPFWKQAEWFYPFVSYGTEVDTIDLIAKVLQAQREDGKPCSVAVPKVVGKEMEFYQITSMEELAPGYHGILEPATSRKVIASQGIMLLPGLAFDREKNRIGYGGGYYDRYLQRYPSRRRITVGVAFDVQILPRIQAQEHDIRPDYILTADGLW